MRRPDFVRILLALAVLAAATPRVAAAQPSTVILVRHAERANQPGTDPELSESGIARSRALALALEHAGVTGIIVTQYRRTALTAASVAEAVKVRPQVVLAQGPIAAHADSVAAAVRRFAPGDVVLVVGHSNTIPAILAALGGPRLPDLCETQYASLFILELHGASPRFIHASYGAADAPASGDCSRAR